MIAFSLDRDAGVAPYRQIVAQVHAGLQLGEIHPGDKLPTADELVEQLGINRNTAIKAYRELRYDGLVTAVPGRGTFVTRSCPAPTARAAGRVCRGLEHWVESARREGLDDESIRAVISRALHAA